MSHIEIKTIKGRQYKYLRKSIREDGKVRCITLKYIGPVDPVSISRKRKVNASIYARQLTKKEKETLKKSTKSSNAFIRDRAKIILLSSESFFAKQIAEKICCEKRKVRTAIKAFNEKGLNALQRGKAPGAVPKFTDADKKAMLIHFYKEPKEFGYVFTAWTMPRFTKHLIDYNVIESISVGAVRLIMKSNKAKLKRSKRWQYSPDKNFLKKEEQ